MQFNHVKTIIKILDYRINTLLSCNLHYNNLSLFFMLVNNKLKTSYFLNRTTKVRT